MRVLVVEDEPKMADVIRRALQREGYSVDLAPTGSEAMWFIESVSFDAVVLDAMIPPPDGFEICRRLRAADVWTPVLMLTARDAVADRVAGLDSGADDYLTKPFAIAELLARLRAMTRREPVARPVQMTVGDLYLDPSTHRVGRGDTPIELSPKEFALLHHFMRHPGEALTRVRIDRPFARSDLQTVPGVGYRLVASTPPS
jgi:two-component system OmpR family response regulator